MSQNDLTIADQLFPAFRADLNGALQALGTLSSGATAPATTFAHMLWADTTAGLLKKRNATNTAWLVVRSLDETMVLSRSANTILAGSDVGKTIVATAGFTQTLTAAATLGDGWFINYRIESGATIVFDPNGAETIDGAATKSIVGPVSGAVFCNGSAFFTIGFPALFDPASPGAIGGTTAAAGSFTQVNSTGNIRAGTTNTTTLDSAANAGSYVLQSGAGSFRFLNSAANAWLPTSSLAHWIASTGTFGFGNSTNPESRDGSLFRAGPNAIVSGDGTLSIATARTEINKAIAAIADNTATATFTVTIPNGAHSASLKVTLAGSLGTGGAIGANEATGNVSYDIAIARTTGVNAVATISTAYGSSNSSVAGAATCTVTAAVSAISGAVGATNTFTVNVTIVRGSGASTNHTCFAYGQLKNANASGITIA